jgi:hypothetical protein
VANPPGYHFDFVRVGFDARQCAKVGTLVFGSLLAVVVGHVVASAVVSRDLDPDVCLSGVGWDPLQVGVLPPAPPEDLDSAAFFERRVGNVPSPGILGFRRRGD